MRRPRLIITAGLGLVSAAVVAGVLTVPASGAPAPALAAPAGATDSVTGCQEDVAGDNSYTRPIAFQRIVNEIPNDVYISKYVQLTGTRTPKRFRDNQFKVKRPLTSGVGRAPILLGQTTPFMEKDSNVKNSKVITAGAYYDTDHWWDSDDRHGCDTNAPFLISQGRGPEATAFSYGGALYRDGQEKWFGLPRMGGYWGPKGYFTWTCRGPVDANADVFWQKQDSGVGFSNDTGNRNGGIAPACQEDYFKGMRVRSKWAMTKMGNLESTPNDDFPRGCEVLANTKAVNCWQEVWKGPWYRTWRFETHIWAVALRAAVSSTTTIEVPAEYTATNRAVDRQIAWRVVEAKIKDGAWPTGFSDFGGLRPDTADAWATPSVYTVPGTGQTFRIAGWGNASAEQQQMTFTLIGDTDGTYEWPKNKAGKALERPVVTVTLPYSVKNFADGQWSCKGGIAVDDTNISNTPDGKHCISGWVPTPYELPESGDAKEKRIASDKPTWTDKDGNLRATITKVKNRYNTGQLNVDITSVDAASSSPNADVTYTIRLSGYIDTLT